MNYETIVKNQLEAVALIRNIDIKAEPEIFFYVGESNCLVGLTIIVDGVLIYKKNMVGDKKDVEELKTTIWADAFGCIFTAGIMSMYTVSKNIL